MEQKEPSTSMESSDIEVFLTGTSLPETRSFTEALATLSTAEAQRLAFFDSTLTGLVHIPISSKESVRHLQVSLWLIGEGKQRVHVPSTTVTKSHEHEEGLIHSFSAPVPFPKIKIDNPKVEVSVEGSVHAAKSSDQKDTVRTVRSGYPADRRNLLSGLAPMGEAPKSVLLDTLIKDNMVDIVPEKQDWEDPREPSPERSLKHTITIPIIRLLNLRIRNVRISKSSILSTIDLEASSRAKDLGITTTLEGIEHGFQRTTHKKFTPTFPIALTKDDFYSFTFLLESHEAINFKSLVTISYSCDNHKIVTKLLTNIDFISPFSASKQPALPPKGSTSPVKLSTSASTSTLANALVIKFIGEKSVKLGVPFTLKLQVHNVTRKPRNLVMVFSGGNDGYVPQLPKIKSLVLPMNTVMRHYSTTRLRPVGLLALDNEVHLKADAGAVFETEIRFVGLETGVTPLQGATITDITTGDSVNCDKMLEIIVE